MKALYLLALALCLPAQQNEPTNRDRLKGLVEDGCRMSCREGSDGRMHCQEVCPKPGCQFVCKDHSDESRTCKEVCPKAAPPLKCPAGRYPYQITGIWRQPESLCLTVAQKAWLVEPIKIWPDTDPPDKSDPHWEFNNNLNINGTPYLKVEVSPGKWRWVVNEESVKAMEATENHRRKLFWALRSRVLTDAEMKEVEEHGSYLNIEPNVGYLESEKSRELNDALLQQAKLRALLMAAPMKGEI